jgi:iron complex outermembrane recepter protein
MRNRQVERMGSAGARLTRFLPLTLVVGLLFLAPGHGSGQAAGATSGQVVNTDQVGGAISGTVLNADQAVGAISGIVVNADQVGITDAEVRLPDLARRTTVDVEGRFTFLAVPPGSYLVEATSPRFGRAVRRLEVRGGGETTITLELDPLFRLDELVVSAGPLSARRSETYQPSSALSGLDLARAVQSSLGETLAGEPGVTSTYNGPGSSRPIIRGLGGDRVRIMEGGVGSGDVSNQGPDHAVAVEPLAAERIEIVRGPATLLYGSAAVGGVVNVIDNRIPRELPGAAVTGSFTGLGGTVADERTGAFELGGALGGNWAWHLSGLRRSTGDYRIPGYAEREDDHDEHGHDEDEVKGLLENSALETTRGALGLSWIGRSGYLGISVLGLDTDYGVPGHGHHAEDEEHGEEDHHDEEDVVIGLEQRRLDLEGSWRFGRPVLKGVKGRFGFADYEHTEFEGDQIGTRFTNRQWEGRLEAQHSFRESLIGASGIQVMGREFAAAGEEAFILPSDHFGVAGFVFQELNLGHVRLQGGARVEGQGVEEKVGNTSRSHFGLSVSGGANWALSEGASLALSASRAVKLPSLEELFADGPHAATFAYELGDPDLDNETAYTLDATLRFTEGRFRGEITGFANRFNGFIYQDFTGGVEDGLPVLKFEQADATFAGLETALELSLMHTGKHHVLLEGWGDYVRASLRDLDQPLPRIPPLRAGTRLRYDGGALRGGIGFTRVAAQERVSPFETETDGYSMLDASVGYRLFTGGVVHDFVLRGTNLTNQEARVHPSYIKDLAPLPGREIRLMYRVYF